MQVRCQLVLLFKILLCVQDNRHSKLNYVLMPRSKSETLQNTMLEYVAWTWTWRLGEDTTWYAITPKIYKSTLKKGLYRSWHACPHACHDSALWLNCPCFLDVRKLLYSGAYSIGFFWGILEWFRSKFISVECDDRHSIWRSSSLRSTSLMCLKNQCSCNLNFTTDILKAVLSCIEHTSNTTNEHKN